MAASSCADNGGSAVRSAAVAENMPTSRPLGDAQAQVAFVGRPLLGHYRPVDIRRRLAEEREPRTDAAGGVVDDAIGCAAHVSRRDVPEALGSLVDEADGLLAAERTDVRERHQDAGAAAVAELVLEVQLTRHEVGRARSAAKRRAPAGGAAPWRGAEPHAHHIDASVHIGERCRHGGSGGQLAKRVLCILQGCCSVYRPIVHCFPI
eukprot:scaffold736_cov63-Phaeocystis_antarctica.AAC.1